jgi:hypothetical protein
MPFLFSITYVACHLGLYTVVLRQTRAVRTERGIFAYHLASYGLLLALLVTAGFTGIAPAAGPAVLFAAGLHGVYSLSFLEAWSLSQGSYSLRILDWIDRAGGAADSATLAQLQTVGSSKHQDRAGDLLRLGLLAAKGRLRPAGRVAARLLQGLLWLSHGRTTN